MTEDQQMLRDTAERYLRDNYDFNQRRDTFRQGLAMNEAHWRAMAEMGWTAMSLGDDCGGLGFGMQECAAVAEQFGRFLVVEPLIDSSVIAGGLIAHAASSEQQAFLQALAAGEAIVVIAHAEPDAQPSMRNTRAVLQRSGAALQLKGKKVFVSGGGAATHFLITARLDGEFACVLVDREASGLTLQTYQSHDGRSAANLDFDVQLPESALIAVGAPAEDAFDDARHRAMLMASAEAIGAMEAALEATVDYTKQREQFGQALSSFQVLQHRMAEMLIQLELTRSLVDAACRAYDDGAADARRLTLAAKVKAATAARSITQQAIQLHGGIATTDEYIVGHFFKRITALESWFVSRDEAIEEFVAVVDAAA